MNPALISRKGTRLANFVSRYRKLAMIDDIPIRRGVSSYSMQDPRLIFDQLALAEGKTFLDMGCGAGDYALRAAELVGKSGSVHAVDISERSPRLVQEEARHRGLTNLHGHVGDIRSRFPCEDDSIDICLICQVLHVLGDRPGSFERVFHEVKRVLRSSGVLVIVEFGMTETLYGPPLSVRIASEELTTSALAAGFTPPSRHDLGTSYLLRFPAAC